MNFVFIVSCRFSFHVSCFLAKCFFVLIWFSILMWRNVCCFKSGEGEEKALALKLRVSSFFILHEIFILHFNNKLCIILLLYILLCVIQLSSFNCDISLRRLWESEFLFNYNLRRRSYLCVLWTLNFKCFWFQPSLLS